MNESQISVRYAKALFQSALEKKVLEKVYEDMKLLFDTCKIEDFNYMLISPSLRESKKYRLVETILDKYISEISMAMIKLVIKNNREIYLPGIARNFGEMYRKSRGIRSVSLVTAREVDESVKERISELIRKTYQSEVELTATVDKDVIGGFILRIGDRQYDASVATSLKKMKEQLLQTCLEK